MDINTPPEDKCIPPGTGGWKESDLEATLDALAEGLIVLDPDGCIVRMNKVAHTVYGYTPEDMRLTLDQRLEVLRFVSLEYGLVPMEKLPGFRALHGEAVLGEVFSFVREDEAAPLMVSMNAVPIRDQAGVITGAVVTFQDITERINSEATLRQLKEYLEMVIETSHCAVFTLDLEGRFLTKNMATVRITGYPKEEALGRHYAAFLPAEAVPQADDMFRQVVVEGRSIVDREVPFVHKDGTPRTFLLSAAPMRENGVVTSIICSGVDITERKRLERDLIQAKNAAEAATRTKSEFLANMSHEIRTPMTGILGMTQLALRACQEPKVREYLTLAKQSGESLLAIINDILDLSKIEAGRVELEKGQLHLRELVALVMESFEHTAQEKNLRLVHSVDGDVPDSLLGDSLRLRQVLTNLVGNAIKFTRRGRVAVTVKCATTAEPCAKNALLVFCIQDTGIGIPEDQLVRIFESFSQAHARTEYAGTGLGLSICKELVSLMGGRIWAESQVGKGSTFMLTVKFDLGGEEQDAGRSLALAAQTGPGPALKVLLVEDNQINQVLALAHLNGLGHKASVAANGREALEAIRREYFDVVLMDVRMPLMDGEEATRRIRAGEAGEAGRDVPIVALTAHALVGDRERFLNLGMNGYLSKPFDMEQLDKALKRVMG